MTAWGQEPESVQSKIVWRPLIGSASATAILIGLTLLVFGEIFWGGIVTGVGAIVFSCVYLSLRSKSRALPEKNVTGRGGQSHGEVPVDSLSARGGQASGAVVSPDLTRGKTVRVAPVSPNRSELREIFETPRTLLDLVEYGKQFGVGLPSVFAVTRASGGVAPLVVTAAPSVTGVQTGFLKALESRAGVPVSSDAALSSLQKNDRAVRIWNAVSKLSSDRVIAPVVLAKNTEESQIRLVMQVILTLLYRSKKEGFQPAILTQDAASTQKIRALWKRILAEEAEDLAQVLEGRLLIGEEGFLKSRIRYQRSVTISLNSQDPLSAIRFSDESQLGVIGYETVQGTPFRARNTAGAVFLESVEARLFGVPATHLRQRVVDQMLAMENEEALRATQAVVQALTAVRRTMIMA